MSKNKTLPVPREIMVAGFSLLGALAGLSVARAIQIDSTKPTMFGSFVGTVVGVYLAKDIK